MTRVSIIQDCVGGQTLEQRQVTQIRSGDLRNVRIGTAARYAPADARSRRLGSRAMVKCE
jgi:hypothetical protein